MEKEKYKKFFTENKDLTLIVSEIVKGNHHIFSSFNDPLIGEVEAYLDKTRIPYSTTSVTGKDYIIAGRRSKYFKESTNKVSGKKELKEAKNLDVVETFVLDHTPNTRMKTKNIVMNETDIGLILVNYSTGIALRASANTNEGWKIYLNSRKYSVSTSSIQNMVRKTCESGMVEIEEVDEATFNNMTMK